MVVELARVVDHTGRHPDAQIKLFARTVPPQHEDPASDQSSVEYYGTVENPTKTNKRQPAS